MSSLINTIHKGDVIAFMKTIPDSYVDLVVTDPPYLIDYKTNHRKDKDHDFCTAIANDNNPEVISDYIKECYRIMKDNTAIYMFCGPDKIDFFKSEVEKYFKYKNIIVWKKNNWTAGDLEGQFGKQYEFIIMANKGRSKIRLGKLDVSSVVKRYSDIWEFPRVAGDQQIHQNQKPVELIEQCICCHSDEGDLVFDGFMGSGTTAVAAKHLRRNFLGAEINDDYWNKIQERIKNASSLSLNDMEDAL